MKTDWNPVNGLIVSCGEDCKYKVWDSYGRQLYQSSPSDHVLTSVAWCPNGESFAVGSFNLLRLCDKTGWPYSRERPECGALFNLAWSSDGTTIAGAGGNGAVIFAQIVEKQLEWQNIVVKLTDNNSLQVLDVFTESDEDIIFRDRVIEFSIGFNHLVVATATQLFIYKVGNWKAALHVIDLRSSVSLIIQCDKHFLTVDNVTGIQLITYDGRILCNPKYPGLRVEILSAKHISVASDCLAILDREGCINMVYPEFKQEIMESVMNAKYKIRAYKYDHSL
jgi:intraflagellar transport protein 80